MSNTIALEAANYWLRKQGKPPLKRFNVVIETHLNRKHFLVAANGRTDASHQAIAAYKEAYPTFYGTMDISVGKAQCTM